MKKDRDNFNDNWIKKQSKILSDTIDSDIMNTLLVADGWIKITLDYYPSNEKEVDILHWARSSCKKGGVRGSGKVWLFEHEKDAMMFALRWV